MEVCPSSNKWSNASSIPVALSTVTVGILVAGLDPVDDDQPPSESPGFELGGKDPGVGRDHRERARTSPAWRRGTGPLRPASFSVTHSTSW